MVGQKGIVFVLRRMDGGSNREDTDIRTAEGKYRTKEDILFCPISARFASWNKNDIYILV